jgi:hypothetical protein
MSRQRRIDRPIFFIGMPRSGTTVMFAAFATHPDLAWFSQYMHRFPRLTGFAALTRLAEVLPRSRAGVMRNGENWTAFNRLQINPAESAGGEYGIWTHCCGPKMQDSFLAAERPSPRERDLLQAKVDATLRYGGKSRFATKLTGPPRIGFLGDAFEDALFVQVVRDPRAVVGSLLRIPFWRDTFRLSEPAWIGGLEEAELEAWRREGSSPAALAALEWQAVVEAGRREAAGLAVGRYLELRYEEFVAEPAEVLERTFEFSGLRPDPGPLEYACGKVGVRDLSENWRERLSAAELRAVEESAGRAMRDLGYEPVAA